MFSKILKAASALFGASAILTLSAFAEDTAAATTASGSSTGGFDWSFLIILGVGILAIYFFVLRPQKKQEKETQSLRDNLEVGDEVTTIGGIIGLVVSIKDDTCVIETGKNKTSMRILKSAIRSVDVRAADKQ